MDLYGQILFRVDEFDEYGKERKTLYVFAQILFRRAFRERFTAIKTGQTVFMEREFPALRARRFIRLFAIVRL